MSISSSPRWTSGRLTGELHKTPAFGRKATEKPQPINRAGDVETGRRAMIQASKLKLRIMRYELADREWLRSARCCYTNRTASPRRSLTE
jgi:hypothetical protein